MNYLELYKKWAKLGRIPDRGLCNTFGDNRSVLEIFRPRGIIYIPDWVFWGADITYLQSPRKCMYEFGPTRQNIVLLLAAMEGQL